jgi:hypothetical protein
MKKYVFEAKVVEVFYGETEKEARDYLHVLYDDIFPGKEFVLVDVVDV